MNLLKWIEVIDEKDDFWCKRKFVCPYCEEWQTYGKTPYCPYCGRKINMDGESWLS